MPRRQAPARPRAYRERPRDERGRWLSRRQIAAYKGVQTKRRRAKEQAKAAAARRAAAEHGRRARESTERRLTPAERARRQRDAARIERAERRRRKKAGRGTIPGQSFARSKKSIGSRGRKQSGSQKRPKSRRIDSGKARRKKARSAEAGAVDVALGTGGDRLRIQIGVRYTLPSGRAASSELLYRAVAHRIDRGDDHKRFRSRIIRWQNPDRDGTAGDWRQGNQEDAWLTLGPPIRAFIRREYGF